MKLSNSTIVDVLPGNTTSESRLRFLGKKGSVGCEFSAELVREVGCSSLLVKRAIVVKLFRFAGIKRVVTFRIWDRFSRQRSALEGSQYVAQKVVFLTKGII